MKAQEVNQILKAEYYIASKGILTQEELTQVLECRPWLFEALADHLAITKQEIRQYVSEGKVSSNDYFMAVIIYKRKNVFHWPESFTGHILEW